MKTQVEQLQRQLKAAYRTSRWHSLQRALEGLKPEEAAWTPAHYKGFPWAKGSILEILFHVAGDTLHQLDYAFGSGTLTWDALKERFERAGGDLKAAQTLLDEAYAELERRLSALTDSDLSRSYRAPDGEKTLQELFEMILEHFLYHAGQIVYVRNLQSGQRSLRADRLQNPAA
ncbi:MAG: DinB family protein [Candidatus Bipolaricaulota bacterium]|nr:DinB family protein [Candidatus Bipolaricaulota bacterium]MCS7274750.1 DinB family protein [Candidatus Bipolaricaulota bacterium]MDW8110030.1 DinB family protein [Candidatus Bipolaricaulota bacterium]MDW8328898.1 DinB family protein [Candidatus Bipolaricaulota bacterium]